MTLTRFLHITDLHFWRIVKNPLHLLNKRLLGNLNLVLRRRHYIRLERAESFIGLLPSIQPDAILVGGDLTTTATSAEYEMARLYLSRIADAGFPIFIVPGNHDLYTYESRRNRRFERNFFSLNPTPCEPSLFLLPGDLPLVAVPTVRPNLLSSRGIILDKDIQKTGDILAGLEYDQTLVLAHYPFLAHTKAYHSTYTRRLANAHALRQMLGAWKRPVLYLAGHVHAFSYTADPHYPNISQLTSKALFYGKRKHTGGFTEIVIDKGKIHVFPWEYRNNWVRCEEVTAGIL